MGAVRYRVEWTDEAEGDALHIVRHFDSRSNAVRMITKFERKAASLESLPMIGRIVPELERIGVVNFREVFIGPWRMQYEIRGYTVFIVAVFDGRRDLAAVLFERFVRP
jgi:toxin ParE1/3/4